MTDGISTSKMQAIYLHGFASGPKSSKAIFFANKLKSVGIETIVPDLADPSFEKMTLTSQLKILHDVTSSTDPERSVVIIGSSMGGLLAAMASRSLSNLSGLILLAPGFGLTKRWPALFKDETMQSWKQNGYMEVFNYAADQKMPLSYEFFEDTALHESEDISVTVPTLIFHGKSDETVPFSASQRFATKNRAYTDLRLLDDDHQLLSSLEYMWTESRAFLSSL